MAESHTPIYGNYYGYYDKRPFLHDPRLQLVAQDNSSFFREKTVLDIGCNEGVVSCEIAQHYGAHLVVGVDIDESLIRSAWARRRKMWSSQQPANLTLKKTKRGSEHSSATAHYFPASLAHMFGPLAIPATPVAEQPTFPHNILFRAADWLTDPIHEDGNGYDIVLAFSLTKWIHLNFGDDGIRTLLTRIYSVLKAGGCLVLEPQSWDGYSKAARMSKVLKDKLSGLKLRPDEFPRLLGDVGFVDPVTLGEAGEGGFRRPLQLYRKPV